MPITTTAAPMTTTPWMTDTTPLAITIHPHTFTKPGLDAGFFVAPATLPPWSRLPRTLNHDASTRGTTEREARDQLAGAELGVGVMVAFSDDDDWGG